MNILVINGSPRMERSNSLRMTAPFSKGSPRPATRRSKN